MFSAKRQNILSKFVNLTLLLGMCLLFLTLSNLSTVLLAFVIIYLLKSVSYCFGIQERANHFLFYVTLTTGFATLSICLYPATLLKLGVLLCISHRFLRTYRIYPFFPFTFQLSVIPYNYIGLRDHNKATKFNINMSFYCT